MPIAQTRLESLQVCKLLQCVRDKDKIQIEKMTMHGVPHLINYNDPSEGQTALGVAACANDDDMIEFLLGIGAHPDVVDFKGRSASMRAAEFGHVQCLEKLAEAGANMKLEDLEGKGILFYCISPTQRHAKCLEIAVTNGAEVNNKSKEGIPVFMLACETATENEETCELLLQKGADASSKQEKTGRTALMAAASSGSVKAARVILEHGGDVNAIDMKHNHASHFAALNGHFEVLVCMSGYSAMFDQTNSEGNTPLHNAATGGNGNCCKFLGQRGANPKPKNNEGNTARTIAKDLNNKDALKECRKAEKTFGKVGKNNEPWAIALYDWIFERQQKLTETFTKYDAEETGKISKDDFVDTLTGMNAPVQDEELKQVVTVHDKDRNGMIDYNDLFGGKKYVNKNYLMSSYEGKKKKKKGGKKGGKKGKFKLAMPICIQEDLERTFGGGPPEVFIEKYVHFTDTCRFDRDRPPAHPLQDDSAWYLQHPEKTYININDATKNGDFDSLKHAFQKGTRVDTRDKYFKTPLMVACAVGNIDMVKFLLENGANINARDNFKWTPLHHGCHSGQLDVVQFLLEHGAEIDSSTMNGGTPLNRAIESSREGVVDCLVHSGIKIGTENKKGNTPMDAAFSWADPRVIDIVQAKFDKLPAASDKKGKKGAAAAKPGKRPQSGPGGDTKENTVPSQMIVSARGAGEEALTRQRKGSILRAASALAGGLDEQEDITYIPLKAWVPQPCSRELIKEKQIQRDRFGWEVDFPEFQMPFQKNFNEKAKIYGGDDD